jgi:SAM-dependent methyltransferase
MKNWLHVAKSILSQSISKRRSHQATPAAPDTGSTNNGVLPDEAFVALNSPASMDYQVVKRGAAITQPVDGWLTRSVAERQMEAYRPLLEQMYAGQPRQDFAAAAEAIRFTGLESPFILEVGCGSGYYCEILSHLLQYPVRYVGLDYSLAMVELARERYPDQLLIAGDATMLPIADQRFDIVMSGGSLMHTLGYEAAIAETRRVSRRWCIFYTVAVLRRRETTILTKMAYGGPTAEIVFNEGHLRHMFYKNQLAVRCVLDCYPYDLEGVLGESTAEKTYVCERVV